MSRSSDDSETRERDKPLRNAAQRRERVMAAIILVLGWTIAYWLWPTGIGDSALSQVSLTGVVRLLASTVTGIVFSVLAAVLWL